MKKISLAIRFGLVTAAVLIAYFLILALFNLHTNPVFSFFNAVITAFGIYEVIRIYKLQKPDEFSYEEGFKAGIITGCVATILFTIFFLVYSTEINAEFLPELLKAMNGGFNINEGLITFIVAIMGFATTIVSALTIMQLFKKSRNMPESK
jgi:multisubunit Na+/H+ antiporter MnhB subunit